MAKIDSIVHTPAGVERKPADHFARVPLQEASLIVEHGIENDLKASKDERQLNVMLAETLADLAAEGLHVSPGQLGEQIVLSGIAASSLVPGARLQLGSQAVIQVAKPRTGCARFEHIQGTPRANVAGRLGVLARVVTAGKIEVGSSVTLLTDAAA